MIRSCVAVLLLAAACLTGRAATAADCGVNFDLCQSQFTVNGLSGTLFSSAPIRAQHPEIRRVLVIVHGTDANVRSYFSTGLRAATDSGKAGETLVIAPLFQEQADRSAMDSSRLLWDNNSNWRHGDLSTTAIKPRVSSFAVMDELIAPLADRKLYPNLQRIVIAGHSAGGQYVQRYAVARRDVAGMPPVSYVVANPSSVVYLDARRPVPGSLTDFAVPAPSKCEPNRNGYGLEQPNSYFKRDSAAAQIERYRARRVTYLAGDADTDPNSPSLSRTCAAMAQGPMRFARLTAFANYMKTFYAPNNHSYAVVPGVGHSAARMLTSPQAIAAMFAD